MSARGKPDVAILLCRVISAGVAFSSFVLMMVAMASDREFGAAHGFLMFAMVAGIFGAAAPWVRR